MFVSGAEFSATSLVSVSSANIGASAIAAGDVATAASAIVVSAIALATMRSACFAALVRTLANRSWFVTLIEPSRASSVMALQAGFSAISIASVCWFPAPSRAISGPRVCVLARDCVFLLVLRSAMSCASSAWSASDPRFRCVRHHGLLVARSALVAGDVGIACVAGRGPRGRGFVKRLMWHEHEEYLRCGCARFDSLPGVVYGLAQRLRRRPRCGDGRFSHGASERVSRSVQKRSAAFSLTSLAASLASLAWRVASSPITASGPNCQRVPARIVRVPASPSVMPV